VLDRRVRKLHPRRFVVDSARVALPWIVAALLGWLKREQREVINLPVVSRLVPERDNQLQRRGPIAIGVQASVEHYI
jgi:hypothetical protein